MGGTGGYGDGRGRSRRLVLGAAAAGAMSVTAAGCGLLDRRKPKPDQPDPLLPMLAETRDLTARYDAAIAAQPSLTARLTPLREATAEHATALAKLIGLSGSTTPPATSPGPSAPATPPASPVDALVDLRAAEQAAQRTATQACLTAPGDRAALLGSIVAARATHQAVLA
ncbi:hypothetical protein [Rhizomonospora bruguierae]|uniref:hypothetical protein n=1 Tax=Rhizomonospora bruguierae TaxID=1581705 RepID=UPI0020C0E01F|nr:hypothetical protein [Micromonospora sp. NBRC 107566]